ncbi:hypothetical protein ABZ383_33760 [Streptomyces sp. NPDC005900]|uniref:hypothetical protein n=1 Tax=Streptomyces sp. NPDC005900 TaxID=3154569 RepID=UPI00340F79E7
MAPKHRRPGAHVVLGDIAQSQARKLPPAERIAVDRALAVLAEDPGAGHPRPTIENGGPMLEYRAPGTSIRIIYTMTTRRTMITVTYFEV